SGRAAPPALLPSQHRVPLRLELRPLLPLRPGVAVRDPIADGEEEAQVVDGAGEVPIRLDLIAGRVVVDRGVLVPLLLAVPLGLADVADPGIGVERRDALLGELEVVGPVEEALLR